MNMTVYAVQRNLPRINTEQLAAGQRCACLFGAQSAKPRKNQTRQAPFHSTRCKKFWISRLPRLEQGARTVYVSVRPK